jgi:hypothetical protein
MSLLGFPVMPYIDINDAEDVLRAIELTDPEVPLDIVLHTPGDSSWRHCRSRGPCATIKAR